MILMRSHRRSFAPVLLPAVALALLAPLAAEAAGAAPQFNLMLGPRTALPWNSHTLFDQLAPETGERPRRQDPFGLDVYVIPQRPGRNSPRYFDFQWRDHDYLDDDGSAGVRLYFYERELGVARIAAGLVRQSWKYLVDRFNYKPSTKVPYILYNSYREFLQTNVFQVEEGTLGVTSPQDLRMTLPYFGERQRFLETSTHEMVHQFTIQKVADRAASAGLETPIQLFPLWFVEGIAEYYAHNQGVDPDTEMWLRDLVLNQQGEIGYDIPAFLEDRPGSFLYTYKYGQARLAFLAETYGEKVIQAILDQSPRMGGNSRRGETREGFSGMVARICGEQAQQIDARWHTWLRKRVYGSYLQSKQDLPDVTELKFKDELDALTTTPDGQLLFYRGVERETGRAKLVLVDRRDPSSSRQLAIDQHPGTESLHPVLRSVMAVTETGVAWFAQSGEADWLHYRTLKRVEFKDPGTNRPQHDLELGRERLIDVLRDGIIEAGDPTFSPDGRTLAFYGLDREGKIDIYLYDLIKPDAHVVRITEDQYSERDLYWNEDGIVFASDATESGKYNLFRIDPLTGARTRLTNAPVDHRYPVALAGEAVVYASDAGGKTDLWFLQNGRTRRLTDFATAISHPQISPNGIYGVSFYGARYRLFEVPTPDLLSLDEQEAIPPALAGEQWQPLPFPDEPIPAESKRYDPLAVGRNWRLEGGQALIGGAGVGFAPVGQGAVQFSDVLRDRSLLVSASVYGSFDLTDALAFYVDRSDRLIYGFGIFRTFQQGRDTRFAGAEKCGTTSADPGQPVPACQVFFMQRQYGAQGLLSYPISVFSRIDASLRVQGLSRSTLTNGVLDASGFATGGLDENEAAKINGTDPNVELALDWGWDTTRYGPGGSVGGSSIVLEAGAGALPGRGADALYSWAQFDAIQTFSLIGRSKVSGRASMGVAEGSRFGRHFFLSSFDNLRGFKFNDNRLLGDGYYIAQAEVAVPLDIFVRFAFFSNITGILGLDFGGVWNLGTAQRNYPAANTLSSVASEAWANRSMDWVVGANFGLGPFELRVQFAKGIDIGTIIPERDSSGGAAWVPNISLHYAYF